MGLACSTNDSKQPSTDIFLDKIIKYLMVPIVGTLALITLIILYLVDKVNCFTSGGVWNNGNMDDFCWNNFTTVKEISTGTFVLGNKLPHKLFPVITICEMLSVVLPLLIWYWCFGKEFKNQITAVIDQSNSLTEYYRMYDKGMRRSINETTLHRELDNYLELLISLFMTKMAKIYHLYTIKWVVVILICHAWIIGQVFLLYPDLIIFADNFLCVHGTDKANCNIPTSTFLRAVWYINIAFLSLIIICTFACLIIIGRPIKYTETFFYTNVPGAMDSRLSDTAQVLFNSKYYALLSRFCEDNTRLCKDPGLSRSLARKYGVLDGLTPGRETIMDKHFPVLQPEQLNKFRFSCELVNSKNDKSSKTKHRSKVRFSKNKDETDTRSIISATDSIISRITLRHKPEKRFKNNKVHHLDRDYYLTPRLMARKIGKDLKSIKNSPRFNSLNSSQRTPRSISSVELGDMEQRSSTPIHRKPEVTSRRNDLKYMDVHPQTTGHYPVFASRNREFNPYAYRLRTMIMQANAKNSSAWKP